MDVRENFIGQKGRGRGSVSLGRVTVRSQELTKHREQCPLLGRRFHD